LSQNVSTVIDNVSSIQFLLDRAALEREYAAKLEALGRKCSQFDGNNNNNSSNSSSSSEFVLTNTMSNHTSQEDLQVLIGVEFTFLLHSIFGVLGQCQQRPI